MKKDFVTEKITCDLLIIGGGTAGCYAAAMLADRKDLRIVIAEKANVIRSGCLAAGVNALNAYISKGHVPEDYVAYAKKDANGIVREDLLLTMAEELNAVTEDLERRGLIILKDENGAYVTRGWRNLKINGENIKPILAQAAAEAENVTILNHVNMTGLKTVDVKEDIGKARARQACCTSYIRVAGAYGFSVNENIFYEIDAKAVLIATGGAAGLYKPNNPGFSRHKMWYPPFNTGAGYAMGIRAGAEMTTLEHRFVALRCKDTIAPTGTIAQGVGAKQVNAKGEVYETRYGITTPERIYGTVEENRAGNGPCYLQTSGITAAQEEELYKAYLNMAPAQTLRWMSAGVGPKDADVEIDGTEPYIVGGHTASGFWVDTNRQTTISGLFAAGDVAGGAPQKYVTGALAEGKIAALAAAKYLDDHFLLSAEAPLSEKTSETATENPLDTANELDTYKRHFSNPASVLSWEQLEEGMQKVMDEYAGGIRSDYRYHASRLAVADGQIRKLMREAEQLHAEDTFDLLHIYELKERLVVCRSLIAHLLARKETRWHTFGENADYPEQSAQELSYVNSVLVDDELRIIRRPLVKGAHYEHSH